LIYLYATPAAPHLDQVAAHAEAGFTINKSRKSPAWLVGVDEGYGSDRVIVVLNGDTLIHPSRMCIESSRLDERLRALVADYPGRVEVREDIKIWGSYCDACSGSGITTYFGKEKECSACSGHGWTVGKDCHGPNYFGTPAELDEQARYWAEDGI
jgi:hypothetical protein